MAKQALIILFTVLAFGILVPWYKGFTFLDPRMLAAYGFSKLRVRFRELYFWMLLACLTLPEVVLLTPLFITGIKLGFYNTYWAHYGAGASHRTGHA